MTAPAGAIVKLYVDLVADVRPDDTIATQTGRCYRVIGVRKQLVGKHRDRQHLEVLVLAPDELATGTIHRIRWYKRGRGRR